MLGIWENQNLQQSMGLDKQVIVDWIYSLQVHVCGDEYQDRAGFRGGTFLGGGSFTDSSSEQPWTYNYGHIAMTYTALLTLRTLGDDWSRVDTGAIIRALQSLQLQDGSFKSIADDSEHDMRFLYCACSISHMLKDWSGINIQKACDYISKCLSFDGAFALLPGQEGHGGSTFCAVASLVLMQKLDSVIDDERRRDLIQWCVRRQVGGMQGRPNKDEDTCYSYWIGGTLRLLGHDGLLDHEELRAFVMACQTKMGGFCKVVDSYPDLLHSYYSIAYLSMSQDWLSDGLVCLKKVNATLGVCEERAALFEPMFP
jgi:geranylgeranyl transferase type-1 subunit beta